MHRVDVIAASFPVARTEEVTPPAHVAPMSRKKSPPSDPKVSKANFNAPTHYDWTGERTSLSFGDLMTPHIMG